MGQARRSTRGHDVFLAPCSEQHRRSEHTGHPRQRHIDPGSRFQDSQGFQGSRGFSRQLRCLSKGAWGILGIIFLLLALAAPSSGLGPFLIVPSQRTPRAKSTNSGYTEERRTGEARLERNQSDAHRTWQLMSFLCDERNQKRKKKRGRGQGSRKPPLLCSSSSFPAFLSHAISHSPIFWLPPPAGLAEDDPPDKTPLLLYSSSSFPALRSHSLSHFLAFRCCGFPHLQA